MDVALVYRVITFDPIQQELNEDEMNIRRHAEEMLATQLEEEWAQWIPDTDHTRIQQNTYLRSIAFFWHMKGLVGQALVECNHEYSHLM